MSEPALKCENYTLKLFIAYKLHVIVIQFRGKSRLLADKLERAFSVLDILSKTNY